MRLRIHRDELKLGMYIDRAVIDNLRKDGDINVHFVKNIFIDSEEKLNKIKNSNIKFLFIDTAKTRKIEPKPGVVKEEPKQPPPEEPKQYIEMVDDIEVIKNDEDEAELLESFDEDEEPKKPKVVRASVPFEQELAVAREIKKEAVNNVKSMFQNAAAGKTFETEETQSQVSEMVKSIFRNKDAMISLTRLKSFDEYTFTHCVNVTALSIALARELGFSKQEVDTVGFGAMLHDIGKVFVPDEVLNKPGKLDPDERLEIQKHTIHAKDLLEKRGDIPETAINMAWEHHERIDGLGYPEGKVGRQIQKESWLISIVDVYDALTSARVYKPGMPAPQVLSILKSKSKEEFRHDYVDKFVEVLGIFPVGSVVEFNTGQIGIVKEINRDDLFKPHVILVMNANKQKMGAPRIIDSSRYDSMKLKITKFHHPGTFGINVEEYLDKDAARI